MSLSYDISLENSVLLDIPCEVWVELMSQLSKAEDLMHLASTCKQALLWTSAHENFCWRNFTEQKWPKFYSMLNDKSLGQNNWRNIAFEILEGKRSFRVQVYNRENHPGFRMSCYDADAFFRKEDGNISLKYLSPLDRTEIIPFDKCRIVPEQYQNLDPMTRYEGGDDAQLKVGDVVEVQWRSIEAHPFGWWHGEVESIESPSGRVKLTFKQFDKEDIFYSISFQQPGMKNLQQATGSGIYGGLRVLSPQEKTEWLKFWQLQSVTPPAVQ